MYAKCSQTARGFCTTIYASLRNESPVVLFFLLIFWGVGGWGGGGLRDFITKENAMSFRIQVVLLDFRASILSEWICLSSSTHITLFAVHIFLKQPFIATEERKKGNLRYIQ